MKKMSRSSYLFTDFQPKLHLLSSLNLSVSISDANLIINYNFISGLLIMRFVQFKNLSAFSNAFSVLTQTTNELLDDLVAANLVFQTYTSDT